MLETSYAYDGMTQHDQPTGNKPLSIVLGIDFGLKRLGVAIGQSITATAAPLKTITLSDQIHPAIIAPIINEWQPDAIIIGYPLHADDSETPLCKPIKRFADELTTHYQLPIFFENEFLSSQEAEHIIKDKRNRGIAKHLSKKGDTDKTAAALILQRWLDKHCNDTKHI